MHLLATEGADPKAVVRERMTRDLKPEVDDALYRCMASAGNSAASDAAPLV